MQLPVLAPFGRVVDVLVADEEERRNRLAVHDGVDDREPPAQLVGSPHELQRVEHVVQQTEVEHDVPLASGFEMVGVADAEVDVADAEVLLHELRAGDVVGAQIDAVDMLRAASREIEAEEAGVAPDVEHLRRREVGAEHVDDGVGDQVAAEQIILHVLAPGLRVDVDRGDAVGEPERDHPRREVVHAHA